jgi:hypothetical protein
MASFCSPLLVLLGTTPIIRQLVFQLTSSIAIIIAASPGATSYLHLLGPNETSEIPTVPITCILRHL